MSGYVIFENAGEIDPLMIRTFGVNVKENDSAIGFFGTGLKYALAILARHDCEVVIQSGDREFLFGRQTITLRGKPFEFVTMDGEPLGFTTEVGKTWDLWMAYRELYCNAKDEDGDCYRSEVRPEPEPGITRVVVTGQKFAEIADNHGKYFLLGEPFLKGSLCDFHNGERHGIFYRRVLVGNLSGRPMRYTYNMTTSVELTEDRVMKNPYLVASEIAKTVLQCDDRGFIRAALTAPEAFHEAHMDFDWPVEPSSAFMEVCESLVHDRIATANGTAIDKYKKHSIKKVAPTPVALNTVEKMMLDKALVFCNRLGFPISYPVVPVETLGESILGLASRSDQVIYVSQRAFMMGTKTVAGTLIEEYIHLKHNLDDCTRGLQNYLLDRLVSQGELMTGEPL